MEGARRVQGCADQCGKQAGATGLARGQASITVLCAVNVVNK